MTWAKAHEHATLGGKARAFLTIDGNTAFAADSDLIDQIIADHHFVIEAGGGWITSFSCGLTRHDECPYSATKGDWRCKCECHR